MDLTDLIFDLEPLESETIDQLFPELNPQEREYLMVVKVILQTNMIYEDMDIFENAVQVLNKMSPDLDKTEGLKPEWIWNALRTITKLRPDTQFSDEVYEYIQFMHKDSGIKFMPDLPGVPRDPYLTKIINISKDKTLPETVDGIQAMRYLKIIDYLKEH